MRAGGRDRAVSRDANAVRMAMRRTQSPFGKALGHVLSTGVMPIWIPYEMEKSCFVR